MLLGLGGVKTVKENDRRAITFCNNLCFREKGTMLGKVRIHGPFYEKGSPVKRVCVGLP